MNSEIVPKKETLKQKFMEIQFVDFKELYLPKVREWIKQKQREHRVTDGYWRVYQELLEELE